MVFSSLAFLFMYLPIVLLIYYAIPRKARNIFLFIANLFFYGWGEPVFVLLMLFSTVVDYTHGILIDKNRHNKKLAKFFVLSSVAINLALLGVFKYTGFITNTLNVVVPFLNIPVVSLPLPIGISFYTFQTMSYSIDVYRNDSPVQKNIFTFGTYVSLFPQLIAGPIVRYKDVAYQLDNRRETLDEFTKGVKLFVVGLAKKVLIANQMGLLCDTLRANHSTNGTLASWVGIIAYSLQIYFDFSGYSDMARGLGNMFGFYFLKNFDYPYISKSITEFWRRWHISLGTWFREYVYIPLGGNRKGKARTLINLMIVWFLTGLWHGASWNFVLWGIYFGIILIFEKLFMLKVLKKLPAFVCHIYSLILIIFGWNIFYFSDDCGGMKGMAEFLESMFKGPFITDTALNTIINFAPLLIIAIVASTPLLRKIYDKISNMRFSFAIEAIATLVALIICTATLANQSYNPFLYFRF